MWMSRFAGWEKPPGSLKDSATWFEEFAALRTARGEADARIEQWATTIDQAWLDGVLSWFSGAIQREVSAPRGFLVTHFFNHQTHHRGQAHALITAAGEKTDDTDLFLVVPNVIA